MIHDFAPPLQDQIYRDSVTLSVFCKGPVHRTSKSFTRHYQPVTVSFIHVHQLGIFAGNHAYWVSSSGFKVHTVDLSAFLSLF